MVPVRIWPALRAFLSRFGKFSLGDGGHESTVKRMQAESTAALVAAAGARPGANTAPEAAARYAEEEAAAVVTALVNAEVIRRAGEATALWVEDRPSKNIFERQSLAALGLSFVQAESTEEALDWIANEKFDVIISDMARPGDSRAGYTLLGELRASGNRTPYVIYTSSRAQEHKAEARDRGALGSTNRASELFGYVLTAISRDG